MKQGDFLYIGLRGSNFLFQFWFVFDFAGPHYDILNSRVRVCDTGGYRGTRFPVYNIGGAVCVSRVDTRTYNSFYNTVTDVHGMKLEVKI